MASLPKRPLQADRRVEMKHNFRPDGLGSHRNVLANRWEQLSKNSCSSWVFAEKLTVLLWFSFIEGDMKNDDLSYNVYWEKDYGSHGTSLQSSCLCKKPRIYLLQMYKCNGRFLWMWCEAWRDCRKNSLFYRFYIINAYKEKCNFLPKTLETWRAQSFRDEAPWLLFLGVTCIF